MPLLGPYTVKDYYQLYQRRRDADHQASWERVNRMVMERGAIVAGLSAASVGVAFGVNYLRNEAATYADAFEQRLAEERTDADVRRRNATAQGPGTASGADPDEPAPDANTLRPPRPGGPPPPGPTRGGPSTSAQEDKAAILRAVVDNLSDEEKKKLRSILGKPPP